MRLKPLCYTLCIRISKHSGWYKDILEATRIVAIRLLWGPMAVLLRVASCIDWVSSQPWSTFSVPLVPLSTPSILSPVCPALLPLHPCTLCTASPPLSRPLYTSISPNLILTSSLMFYPLLSILIAFYHAALKSLIEIRTIRRGSRKYRSWGRK